MRKEDNIVTLIMTKDKQFLTELGAHIRELRKTHGMTQGELADRLGVTQALIASYETARRSIPLRKLVALADIFGIAIEEIIGRTTPKRHKRGPVSKIEERLYAIEKLPRPDQQFVIRMLDNALAQSN